MKTLIIILLPLCLLTFGHPSRAETCDPKLPCAGFTTAPWPMPWMLPAPPVVTPQLADCAHMPCWSGAESGITSHTISDAPIEICVQAEHSFEYPNTKVCGAKPLTTQWLGKITHTSPHPNCMDPGFYPHGCPPDLMFEDDVDVGLRSDGVVVWRKVSK